MIFHDLKFITTSMARSMINIAWFQQLQWSKIYLQVMTVLITWLFGLQMCKQQLNDAPGGEWKDVGCSLLLNRAQKSDCHVRMLNVTVLILLQQWWIPALIQLQCDSRWWFSRGNGKELEETCRKSEEKNGEKMWFLDLDLSLWWMLIYFLLELSTYTIC